MIPLLLQRPVRGEPVGVSNRISASRDRRASFMAHAGLAIVAATALMVSSSAPASAACNVTNGSFVCYEAGTFVGTGNVGQVFATFTNNGTLSTLAAFSWTGGPYAVTNKGTLGSFTFSTYKGGTLLDGFSFTNNGTIQSTATFKTGDFVFKNYGTVGGLVTSNVGDDQILNFAGASLNGGLSTGGGDDAVVNAGTIKGDIDLGSGANSLVNFWLVESGSTLSVGAGNSVENYNVISPGGFDTVKTTTLTGNYNQYASGSYITTLASVTSADKIDVSGTASLGGSIIVNRTGAIGNTGQVAIVTATDRLINSASVTRNGWGYSLTTDSFYDSSIHTMVDRLLLNWNRSDLLTYLGPISLTDQQRNVVTILAGAEAGNAKIRKVNDSLLDSPLATVQSSINQLTPAAYVADLNSWWQANSAFMQSVNSCPTFGESPGFIQEGQCYWAKFGGRRTDWNTTATNTGGHDQAFNFSGGVQVALRDEWRLGFASFYENSTIDTPTSVTTESDRMEGAIVLKNRWDNLSVSATAFAGYNWADTERTLFGNLGTAESDHNSWLAGSNLRVSQLFELPGRWYVKPMVDLNATHITTEDFTEHGADGANLAIEGEGYWVLAASPAIEIGTEITSKGITYRPYVRAGGTFLDDATFDVTASFVAVPGQFFTTSQEFDDKYVDISAGVDILTEDGVDLKLTYDGRYSDESSELSLGAKAAFPF